MAASSCSLRTMRRKMQRRHTRRCLVFVRANPAPLAHPAHCIPMAGLKDSRYQLYTGTQGTCDSELYFDNGDIHTSAPQLGPQLYTPEEPPSEEQWSEPSIEKQELSWQQAVVLQCCPAIPPSCSSPPPMAYKGSGSPEGERGSAEPCCLTKSPHSSNPLLDGGGSGGLEVAQGSQKVATGGSRPPSTPANPVVAPRLFYQPTHPRLLWLFKAKTTMGTKKSRYALFPALK